MNSTMKPRNRSEDARRDMIAGGIVVAAIVMFVGTGGNVMQAVVQTLIGIGGGPDKVLSAALILNVALILFGWRRYEDLNREIRERTEAEQRARYLADTDPLTGFLNRRARDARRHRRARRGTGFVARGFGRPRCAAYPHRRLARHRARQ